MSNIQAQVTDFNQTLFGHAANFAKISLDRAERLVDFQFTAAKQAVASTGEHVKALSAVKDPQEFASIHTRFAESALESITAYSRQLYELATEAQTQFAEVLEAQSSSLYQKAADAAEGVAKSLPVGSDAALAAVKSSVAATTAAVDSIKATARKVSPIKPARPAK